MSDQKYDWFKNVFTYPFRALIATNPSLLVVFEVFLIFEVNLPAVRAESRIVVGVQALVAVPSFITVVE